MPIQNYLWMKSNAMKNKKNENSGWVSVPPHTPDAQSTKARVYPVSVFLVCRRLFYGFCMLILHTINYPSFISVAFALFRQYDLVELPLLLLFYCVFSFIRSGYMLFMPNASKRFLHIQRIASEYSAYNVGQPMFLSLFVTIICSMRKVIFILRILAVHRYWYLSSICCILH